MPKASAVSTILIGWVRGNVKSINTPEEFIARGWDECLSVLDRLDAALVTPNRDADPCLATGEGWVAEEALATGLLCFFLQRSWSFFC